MVKGQKIIDAARTFFEAVRAARRSEDQPEPPLDFVPGHKSRPEGYFWLTRTIIEAERDLIKYSLAHLGSIQGHEGDIKDRAWDHAASYAARPRDVRTAAKEFLDNLVASSESEHEVLLPNFLVDFSEGIGGIAIGPVTAGRSLDLGDQVSSFGIDQVKLQVGHDFDIAFEADGSSLLTLPPVYWRVNLRCTTGNVREQANWLIDVAASLLRFQYEGFAPGLFPYVGDLEPMPCVKPIEAARGIVVNADQAFGGGSSIPTWYQVDANVAKKISHLSFQTAATLVFAPPADSVAERMNRGLGWLTRGRQTSDRAERLLFFFTAIEALLSGGKGTPVVDTIARHAALILANEPCDRAHMARFVRKLYDVRSSLVHAGSRAVSQTDANDVQEIAEVILGSVLKQISLSKPFKEFEEDLRCASYGTSWPP